MKELIALLKKFSSTIEDYNSNNAWGFGGSVGTLYHLSNGDKVLVADACFRHLKSQKFIKVTSANGVEFDVIPSKTNIEQIIKYINEQYEVEK